MQLIFPFVSGNGPSFISSGATTQEGGSCPFSNFESLWRISPLGQGQLIFWYVFSADSSLIGPTKLKNSFLILFFYCPPTPRRYYCIDVDFLSFVLCFRTCAFNFQNFLMQNTHSILNSLRKYACVKPDSFAYGFDVISFVYLHTKLYFSI